VPPRAGCRLVRADAELTPALLADATRLLADLVAHGAALGWVEPPARRAGPDIDGDAGRAGPGGGHGFRVYGQLPEFVTVGRHRFEKVFCVLDLRTGAFGEAPWSHGGTAHPR